MYSIPIVLQKCFQITTVLSKTQCSPHVFDRKEKEVTLIVVAAMPCYSTLWFRVHEPYFFILPTFLSIRPSSLYQEDPLEKKMATHSSIPAWRIPRTEKHGQLQSIGSQTVRSDSATNTHTYTHTHTHTH